MWVEGKAGGGVLANQQMIEDGYGHEYTHQVPYTYQEAFQRAQPSAEEAGRGLWSLDTCAGNP